MLSISLGFPSHAANRNRSLDRQLLRASRRSTFRYAFSISKQTASILNQDKKGRKDGIFQVGSSIVRGD